MTNKKHKEHGHEEAEHGREEVAHGEKLEREEQEEEREKEHRRENEREREEKRERREEHHARSEEKQQEPPVVMPMAASPSFYITINCTYPAGANQIAQATTYQVVTPWGQSTQCINLLDAFNQMITSASSYSGQMWNYIANGVTRGLTTTSATVPVSASYFSALP